MRRFVFAILITFLSKSSPHTQEQESCSTNDETCSQTIQPKLFWHKYTIDDLFAHFKCYDFFDLEESDVVPPPQLPRTLEERELDPQQMDATMRLLEELRIKYQKEVHTVPVANKANAKSVFKVPVLIGDAGIKGRGIYAKEDIPKGTLVLDMDSDNVGIFKDAMQWRQFTYSAGVENAELSCNFMEWCWLQNIEKEEDDADDIRYGWTVFIAFDESGLINNAEWGEEEPNIRCGTLLEEDGVTETWSNCRYKYHALRDIQAGDEILINYSEFEDPSQIGWDEFGVGTGITAHIEASSSRSGITI